MTPRKILFVGCSSGFGKTVATHLYRRNHDVFGAGLNGPDFDFDLESSARPDLYADECMKQAGERDVLIYNAGAIITKPNKEYKLLDFVRQLRVNLVGAYAFAHAFLTKTNFSSPVSAITPRLIFTGSFSSRAACRCAPGYVASKAGLEAMSRALAREYGTLAIFATVAPAQVEDTPMQRQGLRHLIEDRAMTDQQAQRYQINNPMERMISHDEICSVYQFAVEEMPAAMSGTTLWIPLAMGV